MADAAGTIGPAGGTIASDDGRLVLTVPAGALAEETQIVMGFEGRAEGIACHAVVLLADFGGSLVPALLGCALYLVGCIGVTMFGNVPLNQRLANTDPGGDEAESLWGFYLSRWTRWNHVRTAASLAAAACFVLAVGTG